jgi:hypothetical protein
MYRLQQQLKCTGIVFYALLRDYTGSLIGKIIRYVEHNMNPNDEDVYSTYGRRKLLTSLGAIGLGTVALAGIDAAPALAHGENVSQHTETTVTYQTENSWGPITQWYAAPDLTFTINDGIVGNLATLSWRDQQGNAGNISFQSDGSSFFGYYQKVNEGPIAYRGTRK